MKKITFNAPLNHKAYSYEPMKIEVEKVIPLYGKRFEQMRDHPLEDAPEIIENRDLMYREGNTAHCILFLDANGSDGILVEAERADYARKSQFIPNARAIVEANDITAGEQQLHQEMKKMADKIAGLAHRGEHHIYFGNLHESEIIKSLIVKSVAEMLSQRSDIADVKNHYPKIPFQPDYTVTPKPTQEMKLYCPLEIQAEPQIYETDWDAPYEDDLEVIPSSCACGCEDEINAAIEKYSEPEEKHRGLMFYYNEDSPVNEKVVSASPSVEVRNGELVGVLTCQITEPLTDSEMKEFQDWWTGQCSDGWSEGFEQREIKTDAFGTIYVSFWNPSDSWQIEVEMMDETNDIEEEESFDMSMYRRDFMSQFPSRKEVERIKKMYPKGTRIQIERMNDPYHPIERGTKGSVDYVDDIGTLHCTFDNGRCQGVVTDTDIFHVIDRLNVPIAERYAYLLGSAIDGNKRLHNVQEVAEFICKHGQYGDVRITTMEGKELLDAFGIYINKISDMEYREELLKVLVPMQHEVENAAFSENEDMDETDETEDVDMMM